MLQIRIRIQIHPGFGFEKMNESIHLDERGGFNPDPDSDSPITDVYHPAKALNSNFIASTLKSHILAKIKITSNNKSM